MTDVGRRGHLDRAALDLLGEHVERVGGAGEGAGEPAGQARATCSAQFTRSPARRRSSARDQRPPRPRRWLVLDPRHPAVEALLRAVDDAAVEPEAATASSRKALNGQLPAASGRRLVAEQQQEPGSRDDADRRSRGRGGAGLVVGSAAPSPRRSAPFSFHRGIAASARAAGRGSTTTSGCPPCTARPPASARARSGAATGGRRPHRQVRRPRRGPRRRRAPPPPVAIAEARRPAGRAPRTAALAIPHRPPPRRSSR